MYHVSKHLKEKKKTKQRKIISETGVLAKKKKKKPSLSNMQNGEL